MSRGLTVGMLVESRDRGFGRVRTAAGRLRRSPTLMCRGQTGPSRLRRTWQTSAAACCRRRRAFIGALRLDGSTVAWSNTIQALDGYSSAFNQDQRFIDDAIIVVRWRESVRDATQLLADRWIESRRFHDGRHAFVKAYTARLSAYQGMSAISSAVDRSASPPDRSRPPRALGPDPTVPAGR